MEESRIKATLLGSRVVVWDPKEGGRLYREGYYGKFIGISKPKSPDVEAPVELSLIEALYLLERGRISLVDSDGRELKIEDLRRIGREHYALFDDAYEVYRDLRSKGYLSLIHI